MPVAIVLALGLFLKQLTRNSGALVEFAAQALALPAVPQIPNNCPVPILSRWFRHNLRDQREANRLPSVQAVSVPVIWFIDLWRWDAITVRLRMSSKLHSWQLPAYVGSCRAGTLIQLRRSQPDRVLILRDTLVLACAAKQQHVAVTNGAFGNLIIWLVNSTRPLQW